MRYALVFTISLFTQLAFAAPKDAATMMKESQSARETAAKEKDITAKLKKLKEFETSLYATIKDYEKASPTEGGDAEENVVKLSFRFEPLFDLAKAKVSKATCAKAKGQIEKDDQANQPPGAALSDNAKEALNWLDVLCK